MTTDHWQRVKAVLEGTSGLAPDARQEYLNRACAGDPALRAEVESLLSADDQAERFLERAVEAAVESWAGEASLVGRRLGAYEVVRQIGHGGMGSVYLAARVDEEYRKDVAVKVVHAGVDSPDSRRRFLTERQILANLDHPNIARLLDGGTTEDHLPYVVMEYVDGEPLTDFCDRKQLSVDDRLRLFERVCHAVQFAHRNLVVHRDLKPANILVTEDGTPKLLDFGIAKLLGDTADRPVTQTAFRPMTPEYASPEQVRGGRITTATDVYALGVLLCELLSGQRPYRVDHESARAVEDAITAMPPDRPSTALFRMPDEEAEGERPARTPESIAGARRTTPERLRRRLSGDLDVITLTALRKEPERRYGSVELLAQDIRRHLDGLPVHARPDTLAYRTGKFIGRHRGAIAGVAAMIGLATALTVFYGVRLAAERDRAHAEGEKAARVAAFLSGLFEAADPYETQGREVTARQLLEVGAGRVERELAGDPVLQATMMGVIGRVYKSLGDYAEAATFLEAAEAHWRDAGADGLELAGALHDLGSLANEKGEFADAATLLERAYELRRVHLRAPHADLVRTLGLRGRNELDRGDLPLGETLLQEAVSMGRGLSSSPADVEALGFALDNLGRLRTRQARYGDAESLLREALEQRQRAFGGEHPTVGTSLDLLAEVIRLNGKQSEAEAMFREAVAHARRILGDDHPTVTSRLGNLATVIDNLGRSREAIEIHRDVLERNRSARGPTHPSVASTLNNLAASHLGLGEYDDAERSFLEALAIHRANYGAEHPSVATVLNNLAHAMAEKQDFVAAARYQREALAMDRRLLGDGHVYVGMGQVLIGVYLLADGQVADSEAPLREGVAIVSRALGADHRTTAVGLYGLGKFLAAAGRLEEGEDMAREVIRIREAALPEGHWETALAWTLLGDILAGQGRDAEAEPLLVNGFEIVKDQPPGSRNRTEARERVVRYFMSRGQSERAAQVPP
jgi:serine/threonine protein kinase/tetratricopeptide (TPR) repeat protein